MNTSPADQPEPPRRTGVLDRRLSADAPAGRGALVTLAIIAAPVAVLLIGALLVLGRLSPSPAPSPEVAQRSEPDAPTPPAATAERRPRDEAAKSSDRAAPDFLPAPRDRAAAAPAPTTPGPSTPTPAPAPAAGRHGIAPATPWKTLDPATRLTRIGIGSCLHQKHPQPIWQGVLGLSPRPDLFLMIGDNVYGDIKSPDGAELAAAYRDQAAHPELAEARAAMPFLATWDDHDYGGNDQGAAFPHKAIATEMFHEFWRMAPERPDGGGIHYARVYGPPGARVQLVMLDTRSARSAFRQKSASFPHWGRYEPVEDTSLTMLGSAQWNWLEARLAEPAELRLVISSVQVLADGHGFERWGNLPIERERLVDLIAAKSSAPTLLVSGDRHFGVVYARALADGRLLPELTTSSLNRPYGPPKDARNDETLSGFVHQENFGLVDIDWAGRKVTLRLAGIDGKDYDTFAFRFADLVGGAER
ncbi:MAG: alkaline phosphatase D family protein [Hyphomicrobiaceae bacterium]|nr:alkaline phosphatase D family protein [Hyphomicrobiaceae bacterium]